MYCKIYIDCGDREKILFLLTENFGRCTSRLNNHFFSDFDIHIVRNKETVQDNIAENADRFLYYQTIADLDIYSDYIEITDSILHILHNENIHAVASCDYEDKISIKEN